MENRLIVSIFFFLSLTLSFIGAYIGLYIGTFYPELTYPAIITRFFIMFYLIRLTHRINRKRYQQIQDYNNKRIEELFIQNREAKS